MLFSSFRSSSIISALAFWGILFGCTEQKSSADKSLNTEVSFLTSDSIRIYGDYLAGEVDKPAILLCHQGGSNARGEYAWLADTLNSLGYTTLAIDLRSGGQLYGSWNRTIAENQARNPSYCDAYPDIEAAVKYLLEKTQDKKMILWGSSFSGALVIQYAARHPEHVKAVLGFSPASGEPMEGCQPEQDFDKIEMPLLVLRPEREMEIESVKNQIALAQKYNHQTFIAKPGAHGSSMLVEKRIKSDVGPTWNAVISFLQEAP
ncbi:MAG TPA: alpha/beta fold hydrolase [Chitinophagaceae bacterium]|nr:alpha/beta fold hydrolase [Chitinophagaceae bacterium]HRX95162.1 alpha/beta fold hydrolase [Chitinophagaceae bacterium]